jgi:ribA/ribD-fused uncharacterized protein
MASNIPSTPKRTSEVLSSPEIENSGKQHKGENTTGKTTAAITQGMPATNKARTSGQKDNKGTKSDPDMETIQGMFKEIKAELAQNRSENRSKLSSIQEELDGIKVTLDQVVETTKTNNTRFDQLEDRVAKQEVSINKLLSKVSELNSYKERYIKLEAHSRRNNIIISGITSGHTMGENNSATPGGCITVVQDFLVTKLKLNDARESISIERAHKLGKYTGAIQDKRDIIVKFSNYPDRMRVWSARTELKGSDFWLKEDFPQEYVNDRKILQPICTKANKSGHHAFLAVNRLIIDKVAYTVNNLHTLPPNLALSAGEPSKFGVIAFYGRHNPLSTFFPATINIAGEDFATVEHYYQYKKAVACNDDVAAKIRSVADPAMVKKLGDKVTATEDWNKIIDATMEAANFHKFSQHQHLKRCLMNTGDNVLAYGNPGDHYWATGVSVKELLTMPVGSWPGKNSIGEILAQVRESLS